MVRSRSASAIAVALAIALCLGSLPGAAAQGLDWDALGDEAVALLRHYVRIRTVNPPGNESLAADFFAALFTAVGIGHEIIESEPGRGNVVARLPGNGELGGHVVLLNHTDVVPADERFWNVDPFGGDVVDGHVYGRGVADMKADAIVQFLAMAALHRAGIELGRDVIFMATAAEETGGFEGTGYLVRERPDLLEDVEFVLTEGGNVRMVGDRPIHSIETTQKTPLWLRLTARGPAGHGSRAITMSAANRLVRALDRIRTYRPAIRLVPAVAETIRAAAAVETDAALAAEMRIIERTIARPRMLDALEAPFGNLLRNTIAITVLEASSKTNVISAAAVAELDCRLLPGERPELFIASLHDVIDDEEIEIETLLSFEPSASPRDTVLWAAIEEAARRDDARAAVIPTVLAGFTDSHFFRERGIVAYGWSPIRLGPGDGQGHSVDERLAVDSIRRAPRMLFDVLTLLASLPSS